MAPAAPIPRGLDHTAAVAAGGKIYLIGGFDGRFRPIPDVWAYDPKIDAWTPKADLPRPRGALAAALVDGKIYAIGGVGLEGDVGTADEYDPATDTWRPRSPMPTPQRPPCHRGCEFQDLCYRRKVGRLRQESSGQRGVRPEDRFLESGGAATIRGRIYVFGGEAVEGTFDTDERYDPRTDTWEAMPPLPTARHGLGAVDLGDRIYVLAGGPVPGGSQSASNEVFIVLTGIGAAR